MPLPGESRRITAVALALLALLAVLPFLGSLGGEFVYDDRIQILDNPLIHQPELLGQALTHDVWSFKGDRDRAWSNYFRPAFVLWLAGNWRLFGAHPLGWHVTNLALHAGVVLLAFALLRRLGASLPHAFLAAAIFAVHPAHVESVAWISGSPDLLMSVGILGVLVVEAAAPGRLSAAMRIAALALALLALFAKETALLLPLLVSALAWSRNPALPARRRTAASLKATLPYALLAGGFLLLRQQVIGGFATPTPWHVGALDLACTLPGVFVFYLRQVLLPFWIGPSYPLRIVAADNVGFANFVLPLAAALAVTGVWWLANRSSPERLPMFALALLPLAPALNVGAFLPEQIVHDRYLYLPLLGMIGLTVAAARAAYGSARGARDATGARRLPALRRKSLAGALALALVLLLSARTAALVPDYRDERSFFHAAVRADPAASYMWAQLASTEFEGGNFAAAGEAAERALRLQPVTTALLVRADLAMRERRFAAAETDLESVLRSFPHQTAAIERLAIALTSQGKNGEAIELLRRSRTAAPWRHCSLTGNLAVALYLDGQKATALRELESVGKDETLDRSPACELARFRLGSLYRELGRPAEARSAWLDYLRESAGSTEEFHRGPRAEAERAVQGLPAGRPTPQPPG